jgi:cell wall assembly regulator SMI1
VDPEDRRAVRARPQAEASARAFTSTLKRIEAHWITQRVPIADHLAPGLTDEEIDDLLESTGVELNEVVRAIFRWHNGATANDPDLGRAAPDAELPNGKRFYPLAHLLNYWRTTWTERGLEYGREISDDDGPHGPWGPNWFPLFIDQSERAPIVMEASQRRWDTQGPIHIAGLYDADSPQTAAVLSSVVPFFEFLLLWLEHGYLTWDPVLREWTYDESIDKMTFRATWWW